jgi:hypothetical protein
VNSPKMPFVIRWKNGSIRRRIPIGFPTIEKAFTLVISEY